MIGETGTTMLLGRTSIVWQRRRRGGLPRWASWCAVVLESEGLEILQQRRLVVRR